MPLNKIGNVLKGQNLRREVVRYMILDVGIKIHQIGPY